MINFKKKLQQDFPELKINSISIIGEGWDHTALEVNNSIIFRIPRNNYSARISIGPKKEVQLLKKLSGKLSVSIPDPVFIANGYEYFGYQKLPGVIASDIYKEFTNNEKEQFLEDWVKIIIEIEESIPEVEVVNLSFPTATTKESLDIATRVLQIKTIDLPILDFCKKTLNDAIELSSTVQNNYLIHNDLHQKNILVDPITKRISGVIDWSDSLLGSLEKEFSIWEWGHDNLLTKACDIYLLLTTKSININQAKTWRHLEEISDLVEELENGNQKDAKSSLEHIKLWIKEENQ